MEPRAVLICAGKQTPRASKMGLRRWGKLFRTVSARRQWDGFTIIERNAKRPVAEAGALDAIQLNRSSSRASRFLCDDRFCPSPGGGARAAPMRVGRNSTVRPMLESSQRGFVTPYVAGPRMNQRPRTTSPNNEPRSFGSLPMMARTSGATIRAASTQGGIEHRRPRANFQS